MIRSRKTDKWKEGGGLLRGLRTWGRDTGSPWGPSWASAQNWQQTQTKKTSRAVYSPGQRTGQGSSKSRKLFWQRPPSSSQTPSGQLPPTLLWVQQGRRGNWRSIPAPVSPPCLTEADGLLRFPCLVVSGGWYITCRESSLNAGGFLIWNQGGQKQVAAIS